MPGEKIVVSGNFLIDSESRMKAAAAGIYGETSEDPVCGMEVDQAKAKAAGMTSDVPGADLLLLLGRVQGEIRQGPDAVRRDVRQGPATPAGKRLSAAQWEGGQRRTRSRLAMQLASGSAGTSRQRTR